MLAKAATEQRVLVGTQGALECEWWKDTAAPAEHWMVVVFAPLEVAGLLVFGMFAHEYTVTNRRTVMKTSLEDDEAALCGRDTRMLAIAENTVAGMNKVVLCSTSCWYSLVSGVVAGVVTDHSSVEYRHAVADRSSAEDTIGHKAMPGRSPEGVAPQKMIAVGRTMTGSPFRVPLGVLACTACFGIQLVPDAMGKTRLSRQNL